MDPDDLLAHVDFVRSLARSLVQDPHQAADDEQETWLAALEHPPGDRRSLLCWLSRVALNFARRMYWSDKRRKNLERSFEGNGSITSPDRIAEREELRWQLIDAVLGLDDPYRKAVLLRYYDGLQPREIAERLDLPVQTVWIHLKRGLAKLRQRLDARHDGDRKQWLAAVAPLAGLKVGSASAAAGDDGRIYAWGDEWEENRCTSKGGTLAPVGSYEEGRSPFGIYDMTGGVWEWTESPFEAFEGYQPLEITIGRLRVKSDPRFNSSQYVTKGGCYYLGELANRLEVREPALPTDNLSSLGFRCVKEAKPGTCMLAYALEDISNSGFYRNALDRSGLFYTEKTLWSHSDPPSITGYDFLLLCPRCALPLTADEFFETSGKSPIPIGLLSLSRPLKKPRLPPGTYVIAYQCQEDIEPEQEEGTNAVSKKGKEGEDIEIPSHRDAQRKTEKHLIYLKDFEIDGDEYIEAESIAREANRNPVQLFYYPASQELRISMSVPMADGSSLRFHYRIGINEFPF